MVGEANSPRLLWDWGTAYDLFVSLHILHHPEEFDLRASWAAAVRARFPTSDREILEQVETFVGVPLHWIHTLPNPKDSGTVLWSLAQMPAAERLATLTLGPEMPAAAVEILRDVAARQAWNKRDQEALQAAVRSKEPTHQAKAHAKASEGGTKWLTNTLTWWGRPPEEFGERYLAALQTYHQNFFSEEELRIRPALQRALMRAQALAAQQPVAALLGELSQGLEFSSPLAEAFHAAPEALEELVLAPSYWSTPLIWFGQVGAKRELMLFGARPADTSLIPGELVPDAMLRMLKALADPTRLRLLLYLSQEPLTPTQLARRLRLRPPTVTHHLNLLRLAGAVHVTIEAGGERRYAARPEAILAANKGLQEFLKLEPPKADSE